MAASPKSESFPLTVKAGSARVKIYREAKASGTYYRVGFYRGGKRTFLHCATLAGAKGQARAIARQLSRGEEPAREPEGRVRPGGGEAEAGPVAPAAVGPAAEEYPLALVASLTEKLLDRTGRFKGAPHLRLPTAAHEAVAIVDAAREAIQERQRHAVEHSALEAMAADLPPRVRFNQAIKTITGRKKLADAMKDYRDFARAELFVELSAASTRRTQDWRERLFTGEDPDGGALVEEHFVAAKEEGLPAATVADYALRFRQWLPAARKSRLSEAGQKGGRGKKKAKR